MEINTAESYVVGDDLPEPLPHLWTCLTEHAQARGDHPAIRSFHQHKVVLRFTETGGPCTHEVVPYRGDPLIQQRVAVKDGDIVEQEIVWTYAALVAKVEAFAAELYALGVWRGNMIAAFLDNRIEWALLFWVCVRLDAVFVPLNPRMTQSAVEVDHALRVTKPKVVVTLHGEDARELDLEHAIYATLAQDGSGSLAIWPNTLHRRSGSKMKAVPPPANDLDQDLCVVFTSGTTSLPKASVSSYRNFLAPASAYKTYRYLDSGSISLQHIPVFHSWNVCNSIAFWLAGGTVVSPSRSFDARATISIIERAGCTHMLAVPSMIQAMTTHPALHRESLRSIEMIDLAGTIILPNIVKLCMDELGVARVAATYGMTEGNSITAVDAHAMPYERHNIPSVIPCGRVTPGARIRVCEPRSQRVVRRGDLGELHIGGHQVSRGYLDRTTPDFYREDGINWLMTGDQARVDEDGQVYILGRYKDLIIRGGENLSPAAIERCLDSIEGVQDSQVVGMADEIAGEVPVAVIRKTVDLTLSNLDIQQKVAQELGMIFVPQSIIDLHEDLKLDEYPKTLSGKIKKRELPALIAARFQAEKGGPSGHPNTCSVETLIRFWAQITGRKTENISPDENAETFADSITMMRFCNVVSKNLHKTVAVEDLIGEVDIRKQAQIINARPSTRNDVYQQPKRDTPARSGDLEYLYDHKLQASTALHNIFMLAARHKLGSQDIEDVFPSNDTVALMTRSFHLRSWNRRHAYHIPDIKPETVRWALELCLEVHPMFRSLIYIPLYDHGNEQPLYITLRPNPSVLAALISEGHTVEKPSDLSTYRIDDDSIDYARLPGLLFKFLIVQVRSTSSAGLIYFGHHSVFDALSMSMFNSDLDSILRTREPPEPRAAFKPFAEKKFLCRNNPNVTAALAFHASRLRGWSSHRSSLWPPQHAPQFFRGRTAQWTHINGTPGLPHERPILTQPPQGVTGIGHTIPIPNLAALKTIHNISAPTVFLAALALLNVHRTGSSQAFFGQPFAARVWPTETGAPDPTLPNTMDIAGPTWEIAINRIHVDPEQPLLAFLRGIESEQKLLAQHAPHTPFKRLEALLREAGDHPTDNEHELFDSVFRRQCFNWLPSLRGAGYTCLEEVQSLSRADVGLQWNFSQRDDDEGVQLNVLWDDCQMYVEEVQEAMEELAEGVGWVFAGLEGRMEEGGKGEKRGEVVVKTEEDEEEKEVLVGHCPLFRKDRACIHVRGDEMGWAVERGGGGDYAT